MKKTPQLLPCLFALRRAAAGQALALLLPAASWADSPVFDAKASGQTAESRGAASLTFSHTGSAGAKRVLIVSVAFRPPN